MFEDMFCPRHCAGDEDAKMNATTDVFKEQNT